MAEASLTARFSVAMMQDGVSLSLDSGTTSARSFAWRRSVRRLHFWLGAVAMLYIMFVSLSGCAIVFESELYRALSPDPPIAVPGEHRLDAGALKSILAARYPGETVVGIWDRRLSAGMVAEVWLEGANGARRRLIQPWTGEDLGDAQPLGLRVLEFMRRAHVAVLAGTSGRVVNAAGALALIVLSCSGVALRQRRPIRAERNSGVARPKAGPTGRALAYHRAAGLWACLFGVMWGLTGACFAVPPALTALFGTAHESVFEWLYMLHTGTAGGGATRVVWMVSALSLPLLAITGMMMSWQRTFGRFVWRGGAVLRSPQAARPNLPN
jgi:uncharacterized iron-regulated membrane protein